MARKRSAKYDCICMMCGCPCDIGGTKHEGGGQNMKACGKTPRPILRTEWEAMIAADVAAIRAMWKWRTF